MAPTNVLPPSLPRRHRFTVDEYERMANTELLNGDIVNVPPVNAPHWLSR